MSIKIGEVSILTGDVVRMADFYKALLGIENNSNDPVHQFLITEETMLTVYNDGIAHSGQNICLAFTVEDIDLAREKVYSLGAITVQEVMTQPWGTRNMCFLDPDGNCVYLRQFPSNRIPE